MAGQSRCAVRPGCVAARRSRGVTSFLDARPGHSRSCRPARDQPLTRTAGGNTCACPTPAMLAAGPICSLVPISAWSSHPGRRVRTFASSPEPRGSLAWMPGPGRQVLGRRWPLTEGDNLARHAGTRRRRSPAGRGGPMRLVFPDKCGPYFASFESVTRYDRFDIFMTFREGSVVATRVRGSTRTAQPRRTR